MSLYNNFRIVREKRGEKVPESQVDSWEKAAESGLVGGKNGRN